MSSRALIFATAVLATAILLTGCSSSSSSSVDRTPSSSQKTDTPDETMVEEEAEPAPSAAAAAPAMTWEQACIFTDAEVTAAFAPSSKLTPAGTVQGSSSSPGPTCGYPHGDSNAKYTLDGAFEVQVSQISYPAKLGSSSSTWNTGFQASDRATGFAQACAAITADKQASGRTIGPICEAGATADIVFSPVDVIAWVFHDGSAWQVYGNGGLVDDQPTADAVLQLARLAATR